MNIQRTQYYIDCLTYVLYIGIISHVRITHKIALFRAEMTLSEKGAEAHS